MDGTAIQVPCCRLILPMGLERHQVYPLMYVGLLLWDLDRQSIGDLMR